MRVDLLAREGSSNVVLQCAAQGIRCQVHACLELVPGGGKQGPARIARLLEGTLPD